MKTITNNDILKALKPVLIALRCSEKFELDLTYITYMNKNLKGKFGLEYKLDTLSDKIGNLLCDISGANKVVFSLFEGESETTTLWLSVKELSFSRKRNNRDIQATIY